MIDYNNFINKKISTVKPSGIRKFFDIANEMDDVISLSIGANPISRRRGTSVKRALTV